MASDMSGLAKTYQHKTDIEHVLSSPDTYTGSMEAAEWETYVLQKTAEDWAVVRKNITTVPGLFKCFDESLVNARDHYVRMEQGIRSGKTKDMNPVTKIEVTIADDGTITVFNDGDGVDVAKHPELGIWIPEMVFGRLRTSTNYDKSQKKIVGGKNGFGFKLVLIWSKWGEIETVDHRRGLKYTQRFEDNLGTICAPKVSKCRRKPYTKVTFRLDYEQLGLTGLSEDMRSLLSRRVFDLAAVTDKSIRVKLNGEPVPARHFQQYVGLYPSLIAKQSKAYESPNERWEYVVCLSDTDEFAQVSFVNGICTPKGGKHVDYVLNQLIRKLVALIKKKKKVDVRPATVKEQLMLFLRCDIENPAFDSQTKEFMTTQSSKFGSTCQVSDKFVEKVAKMGVMDAACALTEVKECKAAKKTDGAKTRSIRGIPKLVDANRAGTSRSGECTLILCEGDSAKAGIISGLAKTDRDIIGVYPMRGKLFNVRGETAKRVAENKEISELKKILGLETGKTYTAESASARLRYGKVLFMTDQDLDGSHIKGLVINMFDSEWHSLAQIPGFLGFMNTPILKARKGSQELAFYNDGEWEAWREENDIRGWKVKYYKGLGTSTGKEFREYFQKKKIVSFDCTGTSCRDALDKVFNKTRAADRKEWLGGYDRQLFLDTNQPSVTFSDFVGKEMIHFSKYDCDRSIPNMMDGLKTSQRKILYTVLKRNLRSDIKVAQLSGSVSEISCYHHGEASLNGAIKGMAQTYIGSNNLNLLEPKGQFGTRLQGGNDAASERYIFTRMSSITRALFPAADDAILEHLEDDGTPVEPVFYAPVIPLILANGGRGIGTGFSTDIQSYNPLELMDRVGAWLEDASPGPGDEMIPYFEGFRGTVSCLSKGKIAIRGVYEVVSDSQIRVTELPVGFWTEDFKQHLENLTEPQGKSKKTPVIKDFRDLSTDTTVDITITLGSPRAHELHAARVTVSGCSCSAVEKLLKLCVVRSTSNMHVFDKDERLKKFSTPQEMLAKFCEVRLTLYKKRHEHLLRVLAAKANKADNKKRFIEALLNDTIDLRRKSKSVVNSTLEELGFDREDGEYSYLTRMPMDAVSVENVEILRKEAEDAARDLALLQSKTEKDLWKEDLDELRRAYGEHKASREKAQTREADNESSSKTKTKTKTKRLQVKRVRKKA